MDARLDGARGQVEQGLELAIGEAFEIAQRQDEDGLGIELAQRRFDLRQQLTVLGQGGGVAAVLQPVDGLERQEPEGALEPAPAIVVDAEVARQAQRPGQERNVPAEAAEVLEQAQEDLLRQVLRALGVTAEVVGDRVDARPEAVDDLAPGGRIAGRRRGGRGVGRGWGRAGSWSQFTQT